MFDRLVFTLDPDYFPKEKMREIVANLHSKDQHYSGFLTYPIAVCLRATFSHDGRPSCWCASYRFWCL
jgi:hypothetical protein